MNQEEILFGGPEHACYGLNISDPQNSLIEILTTNVTIFGLRKQFLFFINLFIYFGLRWVFVAAHGLSLVAVSRGYSFLQYAGFSLWSLFLLWSTGSRHVGFSSCGMCAQ